MSNSLLRYKLVSEAGFMMNDETLQVILAQFVKLKKDISAVSSGQEKIENYVSVMKNDIRHTQHKYKT
jgi:hypothetical protein